MMIRKSYLAAAAMIVASLSGGAHAALTSFQTFVGNVGVSTDGWGSTTQAGTISANVPAGATVKAAYLYTSTFFNGALTGVGGTLAGTAVNYSTNLGTIPSPACCELTAARADVTSIVKPLVDGGPGGTYNFRITETSDSQDGSALVVVYELASLGTQTVAILDGFARTSGETTTVNFANPIDKTAPGFFAEMRLGIGFSFDGTPCGASSNQTSRVTVNGTTMTENAGCNDDSADASAANGNLITVGGDDDPLSPLNPTVAQDKERYNLANFLTTGDTSMSIRTFNASNNDNIFLLVFASSVEATINRTPEPSALALAGLGLLALGARRRRAAGRA